MATPSRGGGKGNTRQVVRVGKSAKSGMRKVTRPTGYAGRTATSGRGGLSDTALGANNRGSGGKGAPGTGLGSRGSAGGAAGSGGVTSSTTSAGGTPVTPRPTSGTTPVFNPPEMQQTISPVLQGARATSTTSGGSRTTTSQINEPVRAIAPAPTATRSVTGAPKPVGSKSTAKKAGFRTASTTTKPRTKATKAGPKKVGSKSTAKKAVFKSASRTTTERGGGRKAGGNAAAQRAAARKKAAAAAATRTRLQQAAGRGATR